MLIRKVIKAYSGEKDRKVRDFCIRCFVGVEKYLKSSSIATSNAPNPFYLYKQMLWIPLLLTFVGASLGSI